jgi:hypothetical protein
MIALHYYLVQRYIEKDVSLRMETIHLVWEMINEKVVPLGGRYKRRIRFLYFIFYRDVHICCL